jgi:ferredoxin-NADP reductase
VRGTRIVYLTGNDRALSASAIAGHIPDISRCDVFVCGSPAMVAATRKNLLRAGCRRRQIFTEQFGL